MYRNGWAEIFKRARIIATPRSQLSQSIIAGAISAEEAADSIS